MVKVELYCKNCEKEMEGDSIHTSSLDGKTQAKGFSCPDCSVNVLVTLITEPNDPFESLVSASQ